MRSNSSSRSSSHLLSSSRLRRPLLHPWARCRPPHDETGTRVRRGRGATARRRPGVRVVAGGDRTPPQRGRDGHEGRGRDPAVAGTVLAMAFAGGRIAPWIAAARTPPGEDRVSCVFFRLARIALGHRFSRIETLFCFTLQRSGFWLSRLIPHSFCLR